MLAARRMMNRRVRPPFLDYVGCVSSDGWVMASPMTIGKRISGTWHYQNQNFNTLTPVGLADAYSIETVVTTDPGSYPHYCDWWTAAAGSPTSGTVLETDDSTITLYLFHSGSVVLSDGGYPHPVVGDTLYTVVDFIAKTAVTEINGITVMSLDFSGEPWYTADGANA